MVQLVKGLATMPDNVSSTWWKERTDTCKVSSGLHTWYMSMLKQTYTWRHHMHMHTHTHVHTTYKHVQRKKEKIKGFKRLCHCSDHLQSQHLKEWKHKDKQSQPQQHNYVIFNFGLEILLQRKLRLLGQEGLVWSRKMGNYPLTMFLQASVFYHPSQAR